MSFTVEIQWQPEAAIRSLAPSELQQVQSALNRLEEGHFNDDPQVYKIKGIEGEPDFYVLRVNDRLRMLFTIDVDRQTVVVRDMVSREFVRRYA